MLEDQSVIENHISYIAKPEVRIRSCFRFTVIGFGNVCYWLFLPVYIVSHISFSGLHFTTA